MARGYDADVDACEEAQSVEPFPNVRYHARYVGLPRDHPFVRRRRADSTQWPDANFWTRTTAAAAASRERTDRPTPPLADASTLLGVPDIVREESLETVDFLKIDVDGPDIEVLESAREVLGELKVLGVGLEVNWFGTANPTEHTFHNTDRSLRSAGYSLAGVTTRAYSRVDLPAPFELELFAQTRFGQPYQGDAIYLRDLAAPHNAALAATYPPGKLMKLACLYELAGLPDCAAEIVNRFARELRVLGITDEWLDALTPRLLGREVTYSEYVDAFARAPELFLPSAAPAPAPDAPLLWTPEVEAAKRQEWLAEFVAARGTLPRRALRRLRHEIGRVSRLA